MKLKKIYNFFLILIFSSFFVVSGLFAYWFIRPNTAYLDPDLSVESWDLPMQSSHNAFTDLISWNYDDWFYLAFRTAPSHGPTEESQIIVWKSPDTKNWYLSNEFNLTGKDVRDPKLAVIGSRLFIYIVVREIGSTGSDEITTTYYSYTEDGFDWQDLKEILPKNKRFWRPKTNNSNYWYCPVFEDEKIELYNTTDGINWMKTSTLLEGQGANEVDIEFLPSGRMIAVIRQQFGVEITGTIIAVSNYNYSEWTYSQIDFARLDGPCLFSYQEKIYAVARWQPEVDPILQQVGSPLAKQRTALYLIQPENITYLSDLPSQGDTSYPGAVIKGNFIYISYYTNDPLWDFPWFLGMLMPTRVRIAKISLSNLESLVINRIAEDAILPQFPWFDYVYFFGILLLSLYISLKII